LGTYSPKVSPCADIKESPVGVLASEDSGILFIPFAKMIHTCESSCSFHQRLVGNVVSAPGRKIPLSQHETRACLETEYQGEVDGHIFPSRPPAPPKTQTGPADAAGSNGHAGKSSRRRSSPTLAFELADYLFVDRSALSRELGKMQKDGLISIEKNRFLLHF
jgi:hypothetical protein